jgi:uncharacterized protein
MSQTRHPLSLADLQQRLRPLCEKHHLRRLEIFGSAARGEAEPGSDVDLLVTFDDSAPLSTATLLDMAGEAEELVGAPVDFVLRTSLDKSPNRFARERILSTAVCVYGFFAEKIHTPPPATP